MLLVASVTAAVVILVVGVHYEVLRLASRLVEKAGHSLRFRIGLALLGAIAGHIVEITLFAAAYRLVISLAGRGELIDALGARAHNFGDFVYFSFVVYTSLGFGDIFPTGAVRLLVSGEVLTGLVLIAWTASFLYLLMQRYWER